MSEPTLTRLHCPKCGSSNLQEIDQVLATQPVIVTRDEMGNVELNYPGDSTVHWESSEGHGVECGETKCEWESTSPEWETELADPPAPLAVVATP